MHNKKSFFGASLALSVALLAGRLAGLFREIELAKIFGIGADADIAIILLSIPDLLVNLLISGGLSAALVPRFLSLNSSQSAALFRQVSVFLAIIFIPLSIVTIFLPNTVFKILAPGVNLPLTVTRYCLVAVALAIPLTGVAGVASAYLNSKNKYFVAGCGTLIFNVVIIVMLQFYHFSEQGGFEKNKFVLLSLGIGAGAFLRWLALVLALPKTPEEKYKHLLIDYSLTKSFFYAAFSASLLLVAPILIRAIASLTGEGVIAAFNYTQKLIELPVGVFFASVSTIALTRMSQGFSENKVNDIQNVFISYTRYCLALAMVVLVIGFWFAEPIVQVIYARGDFDESATKRIVDLFRIGVLSLPLIAASLMATAYLNAKNQNLLVLKISVLSLCVLPIFTLPGLLKHSETGLMYAVVAFYAFNVTALMFATKLHILGKGALIDVRILRNITLCLMPVLTIILLDYQLPSYSLWVKLSLLCISFLSSLYFISRLFRVKI